MKVKFFPQNIECEIQPGQSVLQVAQENGMQIKSVCKGVPSCAECRVKVKEGEFNVLPPSTVETNLIGTLHFLDHSRLSCQLRCFGDITVDLTEQLEKAQNPTTKRPRSASFVKKEVSGEESMAKQGNIILEEDTGVHKLGEKTRHDINLNLAESRLYEEETRAALNQIRARKVDPRPSGGGGPRGGAGNSGPRGASGGGNRDGSSREGGGTGSSGSQTRPRNTEGAGPRSQDRNGRGPEGGRPQRGPQQNSKKPNRS